MPDSSDNLPHHHAPHDGVSLREYVESRFASLHELMQARFSAEAEAVKAALASQSLAVNKYQGEIQERFAKANEFRDAMKDAASLFATRAEVEKDIKGLEGRLIVVEKSVSDHHAQSQGKGDVTGKLWAAIIAIAVAVAIAAVLGLANAMKQNTDRVTTIEQRSASGQPIGSQTTTTK